jgi:hypothetical protein
MKRHLGETMHKGKACLWNKHRGKRASPTAKKGGGQFSHLSFSGPESGKAQKVTKTQPSWKHLAAGSNSTPRATCGKEAEPDAKRQAPEN